MPDNLTTPPTCTCGATSVIYADDEVTPLCGRCWLAIYDREADDAV